MALAVADFRMKMAKEKPLGGEEVAEEEALEALLKEGKPEAHC